MGKKKSVVLMTLITIVIVVLCAITAFPAFTLPFTEGIDSWNPAVLQYDESSEFGGGYYAYYYPQGVISEKEYEDNTKVSDNASEEEKAEIEEYASSYKKHGGLYLSIDPEDGIYTGGNQETVSENFKKAFDQAAELVNERFAERAAKTGSDFRVAIVDDYAIRVEVSATEKTDGVDSPLEHVAQAMAWYSLTDKLTFMKGEEVISELQGDEADIRSLIKNVSVVMRYDVAWINITFTKAGKTMIESFKNDTESTDTLDLTIGTGENKATLLSISQDNVNTKSEVECGLANKEDRLLADTLCVLINSAMKNGGITIGDNENLAFSFKTLTSSEIRSFEPVYGDVLVWVYVAVLAVMIAIVVLAIVKMGGFGIVNLYVTLSYFVIVALCYAFITGGVFAVSLGSIFIFLAGLVLANVLQVYIYNAIKAEAALGKTIASSVKGGYKKTLLGIVDTYAVLILGAIALLIGAAGLNTIALQSIICLVAAAFCNLVWGRVINVMLLSASKDKYKYFRLVREDDDDE